MSSDPSKNVIIAMPPADSESTMPPESLSKREQPEENNQPSDGIQDEANPRKKVVFADEIVVDGKKVLDITADKLFYTEPEYEREKTSRWSDPVQRKKVEISDIHFDPIKSLIGNKAITSMPLLAIEGPNPILQVVKPDDPNQPKTRPTKWGEPWEKVFSPPAFPAISRNLPLHDLEYLIRLYRLDELIKKKNLGQYEVVDQDVRSPSPEPIYDKNGKRVNTTEQRMKDEMNREIQVLIDDLQNMNPKFVPPSDWKNLKKSRKIFLPETFSENQNNYAGTILGQGGQVQKRLEAKSGCKIAIRGRQSYMKRRFDYDPNEPTHVLIQAENDEDLAKGVDMVERVLRGEPEELTEEEKNTKYTVAAFESVMTKACENCGEFGHKIWECPNKIISKKPTIQCQICGDKSHPTIDCPLKRYGVSAESVGVHKDFLNFMKDINDEIAEKPLPNNPLSHINFITSNSRASGLALKNSAQNPEKTAMATQSAVQTFQVPPARQPSSEGPPKAIEAPPAVVLPPIPKTSSDEQKK